MYYIDTSKDVIVSEKSQNSSIKIVYKTCKFNIGEVTVICLPSVCHVYLYVLKNISVQHYEQI